METISSFTDVVSENKVFVNPEASSLENSTVKFSGQNNVLFVEDGVHIKDSLISFPGSGAVIYLGKSWHPYFVKIDAFNNTCIYIGRNNYMNSKLELIASERKNIIIGNDGLFARDITVRVADPHLLYDIQSKKRVNPSKSVLIGDHVWVGQHALILKGTVLGSGSVLGGGSVVSGKTIPSNVVAAGNPARIVREEVFFSGECVHSWTEEETKQYETMDAKQWIYKDSGCAISIEEIDEGLEQQISSEDKLSFLQVILVEKQEKNRFYQAAETKQSKKRFGGKSAS